MQNHAACGPSPPKQRRLDTDEFAEWETGSKEYSVKGGSPLIWVFCLSGDGEILPPARGIARSCRPIGVLNA